MINACSDFRNYLRTNSIRDMLIGTISDSYKEAYGFRPRFNYSSMNLVELWAAAREYEIAAAESMDYWDQEQVEAAWRLQEEADAARWEEVCPTRWDYVADRLSGVKVTRRKAALS